MPSVAEEYIFESQDKYLHHQLAHRLEQLGTAVQAILKGESIDVADVAYLMSQARQLLEHRNAADWKEFQQLRLYCHLCLHISLDRDLLLVDVLDGIAAGMIAALRGARPVFEIAKEVIPGALAPHKTREEMSRLYYEFGLPTDFWAIDQIWESFVAHLAELIVFKPIQLPRDIVRSELARAGAIEIPTPRNSHPPRRRVRFRQRCEEYFRGMAAAFGPNIGVKAVPISIQLSSTALLLQSAQASERTFLASALPGAYFWSVSTPDRAQIVAPFIP
jgi:hypothetical protein